MGIGEPHEGQGTFLPAKWSGAANRFPHWHPTLIVMGRFPTLANAGCPTERYLTNLMQSVNQHAVDAQAVTTPYHSLAGCGAARLE